MTGTQRMRVDTTGTAGVVHGGRRRAEQLALLGLAMVAGVVGFALVIFWGIALILMGILWGMMAMERQRYAEPDKGVLAEVVDVVVDAAKDVAHTGTRRDADAPVHSQPQPPQPPQPPTRRFVTDGRSRQQSGSPLD